MHRCTAFHHCAVIAAKTSGCSFKKESVVLLKWALKRAPMVVRTSPVPPHARWPTELLLCGVLSRRCFRYSVQPRNCANLRTDVIQAWFAAPGQYQTRHVLVGGYLSLILWNISTSNRLVVILVHHDWFRDNFEQDYLVAIAWRCIQAVLLMSLMSKVFPWQSYHKLNKLLDGPFYYFWKRKTCGEQKKPFHFIKSPRVKYTAVTTVCLLETRPEILTKFMSSLSSRMFKQASNMLVLWVSHSCSRAYSERVRLHVCQPLRCPFSGYKVPM